MVVVSEVLFRSGNIEITDSLAKFGNATYPIANIGSITIVEIPKSHGGAIFVVALIVGLVVSAGAGAGIGAAVGFGSFVLLMALVGKAPPTHHLTLKTSSGDVTALETKDLRLVSDVKGAIETAFSKR